MGLICGRRERGKAKPSIDRPGIGMCRIKGQNPIITEMSGRKGVAGSVVRVLSLEPESGY